MNNIAVVGAGHLGKIHIKLLKSLEGVRPMVVEPGETARTQVKNDYGVPVYESLSEIRENLDGAIVVTPTETHFDVARQLLDRGCHLLVEKPICGNSLDARKLCSFAEVKGRVLQVGHVERFNPAFLAAEELTGDPHYIESTRNTPYSFRATDVSVILDLMIHDIDLALSLVDSPVSNVRATGRSVIGPHYDFVKAWIEFENGSVACLGASRCSHAPDRSMQINNAQGQVNIDFAKQSVTSMQVAQDIHSLSGKLSPEEQQSARDSMFHRWLPVNDVVVEPQNAILEEQKEFLECIRSNRFPTVCGNDGLQAVKVAEQIAQSVEERAENSMGSTSTAMESTGQRVERPAVIHGSSSSDKSKIPHAA